MLGIIQSVMTKWHCALLEDCLSIFGIVQYNDFMLPLEQSMLCNFAIGSDRHPPQVFSFLPLKTSQ